MSVTPDSRDGVSTRPKKPMPIPSPRGVRSTSTAGREVSSASTAGTSRQDDRENKFSNIYEQLRKLNARVDQVEERRAGTSIEHRLRSPIGSPAASPAGMPAKARSGLFDDDASIASSSSTKFSTPSAPSPNPRNSSAPRVPGFAGRLSRNSSDEPAAAGKSRDSPTQSVLSNARWSFRSSEEQRAEPTTAVWKPRDLYAPSSDPPPSNLRDSSSSKQDAEPASLSNPCNSTGAEPASPSNPCNSTGGVVDEKTEFLASPGVSFSDKEKVVLQDVDHDYDATALVSKYHLQWDHEQAQSFSGPDNIETALTDFDMVFVFPNPGHVKEYSQLCWNAVSSNVSLRSTAQLQRKSEASVAAFTKGLEKVREKQEQTFIEELIARESTRHESHGPKIMLRCTKCNSPFKTGAGLRLTHICPRCQGKLEEVIKKCSSCANGANPWKSRCPYCHCDNLIEKGHPLPAKGACGLHPQAVSAYAADLLKCLFIDPRQAENVDVSSDISGFSDTCRAAIDIMLSFFRAQTEDDYFTYIFKSVDFGEIFLCVKIAEKTAKEHAEADQYRLLLDKERIAKPIDEGGLDIKYSGTEGRFWCCARSLTRLNSLYLSYFDSAGQWKELQNEMEVASSGGPVGYGAGMEPLLRQYVEESTKAKSSILRKSDRIRLLYDKVTDAISVQDMVAWGLLKDFYPLHTKQALARLKNSWARVSLAYTYKQPMHLIHDYFGEHIALYFVFLEHMLKYMGMLVVMALIIMGIEITVEWRDRWQISHGSLIRILGGKAGIPGLRLVWSFGIILWCQLLQIRLKRKVNNKCSIWGADSRVSSTIKDEQNPRFALYATISVSDLNDNELELNVPWARRMRGRVRSQVGTIAFVCVSTAFSMGTLWLQSYFYRHDLAAPSHWMSYILSLEIKLFNALWSYVAQWLVDHEYYRWRRGHDNQMAYKTFIVQVINTFVSFFYIAFAMKFLGDTSFKEYGDWSDGEGKHNSTGPWPYLTYQMISTFGLYLVFSVYDLIAPLGYLKWEKRKARGWLKEIHEEKWKYSFIEVQSKMAEYGGDRQNDDYMQILLPVGFVILFGATLPLSSVFCWIYASLQLRVNAWKLCHTMRRPYPRTTIPGAWKWEEMIDLFMEFATITNIALICFTMEPMQDYGWSFKTAVFFSLMFFTSVIRRILHQLHPVVSDVVLLARKRHNYQRGVCDNVFKSAKELRRLKLRANKNLKFDAEVGRLRHSSYKSSNVDIDVDRWLVDHVYQREMPKTFWGGMKEEEAQDLDWNAVRGGRFV